MKKGVSGSEFLVTQAGNTLYFYDIDNIDEAIGWYTTNFRALALSSLPSPMNKEAPTYEEKRAKENEEKRVAAVRQVSLSNFGEKGK
jgi:hypothetical protein